MTRESFLLTFTCFYKITEILHALIVQKPIVYCTSKPIEHFKYFIKAIDRTFYRFTGVIKHLGCWTPIGFSGSGIWLILRPGFGIFGGKGSEIRDFRYEREHGIWEFYKVGFGKYRLQEPRSGISPVRKRKSFHLGRKALGL